MSQTEAPKLRKHLNPDYDTANAVREAAKVGDQAFHAWRAGQKVFMDIVPGVELHTVDGDAYVWDGEDWNQLLSHSQITASSTVQFTTGDVDLDILMSFAVDASNELAGMQDHDNYKAALLRIKGRLGHAPFLPERGSMMRGDDGLMRVWSGQEWQFVFKT